MRGTFLEETEKLVGFYRIAAAAAIVAVSLFLAANPADAQKPLPPPAAHATDTDGDKILDDLESLISPADRDQAFPVIVLLEEPLTPDRVKGLQRNVGPFDLGFEYESVDGFAASLTKGQILGLSRLSQVVQIEWDRPVAPALDEATTWFGVNKARTDFGLNGNADGAGTYSKDDIVIAVLDTGIDTGHVDLDGGKVIAWKDIVNGQSSSYDEGSLCGYHGTHVASIAAGEGQGNAAYTGVASGAALVGLKVIAIQPVPGEGNQCVGFTSQINAGIQWVIDNYQRNAGTEGGDAPDAGIEIINMSLGGGSCSDGQDSMSQLVDAAVAAGIVVVVAAGNDGPASCTVGSPAAAADAITVGAMADPAHGSAVAFGCGGAPAGGFYLTCFSSRGPTFDGRTKPDVAAPGMNIMAVAGGTANSYVNQSGTSMASPFVAGVAALMLHADISLTPTQVKSTIMDTAVDWGPVGPDIDYGAGRLDAYEAIRVAKGATGTNIALPNHQAVAGALAAAGQPGESDSYVISITDATQPIAVTLIMPTWDSSGDVDFDMELLDKDDVPVAISETVSRQETIGVTSPANGPYTLTVYAYAAGSFASQGGPYALDISVGGSVVGGDIPVEAPNMEAGRITLNHNWTTVSLTKSFTNPVVVARPASINGSDPTVVRIRNVTGSSFELRLQEWDYLDGIHTNEEVDYLVVEAGIYILPNGARLEAGTLSTNATNSFVTRPFSMSFPSSPAVVTSIMTFNGSQAVTTRVSDVATFNFQVMMREQEAQDNVHAVETIGYVAWEPGSGTIDGSVAYEVGTANSVTDAFSAIAFSNTYATPPCLLADMNTTNGTNTANLRWKSKTTSSVRVQVDEEQSRDAETKHTREKVIYIAVDCPPPAVQLEAGKITLNHNWTTVSLVKSFTNPVVVARPASINGSDPTVVRIRNVTGSSFELRLQEWEYLDGTHTNEEVDYLVVEAGIYILPNGARLEAGTLSTNATNSFVTRPFSMSFPSSPAVVTSIMTFNGSQAVTTRVSDVATFNFQVMMREQEAQDNVHAVETIGYVAWEPGNGTIDGSVAYEVGTANSVTDAFSAIAFSNTYATPPCLLADMNTTNGTNTANLRWKSKTTSSVRVQVDEEQSRDAETKHTGEKVAFIAFACSP